MQSPFSSRLNLRWRHRDRGSTTPTGGEHDEGWLSLNSVPLLQLRNDTRRGCFPSNGWLPQRSIHDTMFFFLSHLFLSVRECVHRGVAYECYGRFCGGLTLEGIFLGGLKMMIKKK